jgi:hypothetical protein
MKFLIVQTQQNIQKNKYSKYYKIWPLINFSHKYTSAMLNPHIDTTCKLCTYTMNPYRYCNESFLRIRNSSTEYKECVLKYHFTVTLNCLSLFIRLLRVDGRLLNILIPEQYELKRERLATAPADGSCSLY